MVTEEKVRELAYSLWEQEGRPSGKDLEHYVRARRMLEEQETVKDAIMAETAIAEEAAPLAGSDGSSSPRVRRSTKKASAESGTQPAARKRSTRSKKE